MAGLSASRTPTRFAFWLYDAVREPVAPAVPAAWSMSAPDRVALPEDSRVVIPEGAVQVPELAALVAPVTMTSWSPFTVVVIDPATTDVPAVVLPEEKTSIGAFGSTPR